jgi:oligoendopeptidase F
MTQNGNTSRLVVVMLVLVALAFGTAQAYTPDPATPRSDIPTDYTWDWSHVFDGVEQWETELTAVQALVPELAQYEGRLGESADTLFEAVSKMETTIQRLMRLYAYTQLRLDVELSDADNQAMQGKVGFLFQQYSGTVSYMTPELLALPTETIDGFIANKDELKIYEYYIRDIQRMKEHTLSKAEERILSMTGQVRGASADVADKLRDIDMTFPDILAADGTMKPLTLSGFGRARSSGSYAQRKLASEVFFTTFRQYENTLASTLDGVVKSHLLTKELRGYDSCLEASLKGDNINPAVYRMLIDTVNANLERTLHKYVALRQKVLGLDGPLDFSNLYNPLLDGEERTYEYEECRTMLAEGLKPLGKEYVGLVETAANPANGWIDVYPNKNKRTGAYSSGIVAWMDGGHPYVLHNYDNTLDAVFTTAHEFGHALHTYYSYKNQPFIYGDYTTFLAEVASTCNEEILLTHLLKKEKDPVQRLMLLNKRMENIRLTIFRQTLFSEFELLFHEYAEDDNTLTADFLNGLYSDLIQKYYGPGFAMGENDEVEWAFIPHFNYNFYVFTYATGLTSGISLAKEIEKHGQKASDRYIDNMLKGGSGAPPLDLLRAAGVDMETPAPILTMLDLFEDTVDEFDKLWTKTFGKN